MELTPGLEPGTSELRIRRSACLSYVSDYLEPSCGYLFHGRDSETVDDVPFAHVEEFPPLSCG